MSKLESQTEILLRYTDTICDPIQETRHMSQVTTSPESHLNVKTFLNKNLFGGRNAFSSM